MEVLPWLDRELEGHSYAGAFPRVYEPEADIEEEEPDRNRIPIALKQAWAKKHHAPAPGPDAAEAGSHSAEQPLIPSSCRDVSSLIKLIQDVKFSIDYRSAVLGSGSGVRSQIWKCAGDALQPQTTAEATAPALEPKPSPESQTFTSRETLADVVQEAVRKSLRATRHAAVPSPLQRRALLSLGRPDIHSLDFIDPLHQEIDESEEDTPDAGGPVPDLDSSVGTDELVTIPHRALLAASDAHEIQAFDTLVTLYDNPAPDASPLAAPALSAPEVAPLRDLTKFQRNGRGRILQGNQHEESAFESLLSDFGPDAAAHSPAEAGQGAPASEPPTALVPAMSTTDKTQHGNGGSRKLHDDAHELSAFKSLEYLFGVPDSDAAASPAAAAAAPALAPRAGGRRKLHITGDAHELSAFEILESLFGSPEISAPAPAAAPVPAAGVRAIHGRRLQDDAHEEAALKSLLALYSGPEPAAADAPSASPAQAPAPASAAEHVRRHRLLAKLQKPLFPRAVFNAASLLAPAPPPKPSGALHSTTKPRWAQICASVRDHVSLKVSCRSTCRQLCIGFSRQC
jgi:hypothetical protein